MAVPLGDVNDTSYPAFTCAVGALAMGASTWRWMLRHVVGAGQPPALYTQPTWVFTHGTPEALSGRRHPLRV